MDLNAIRRRLDDERESLVRLGETIERLPLVTRIVRGAVAGANAGIDGADGIHEIAFSRLTDASADDAIAAQIEHYRRLGTAFEWKVFAHDHPVDLRDRLVRHGFTIGPAEAVLVLDLKQPPVWMNAAAAGFSIVRVTTEKHLAMFREAAEAIFGKDWSFTAGELRRAINAHSTEHLGYIAIENDQAVSIGRLYTHRESHFGGLYGGGTRASHRGRGYYRALVAARGRDAIQLGARNLTVDSLPTSQPILARLGFVQISETWPCIWRPS